MKRILPLMFIIVVLCGCMPWGLDKKTGGGIAVVPIESEAQNMPDNGQAGKNISPGEDNTMKLSVSDGTNTVVYRLNDSGPAQSLYGMLPMNVTVKDYDDNEKIFYPEKEISAAGGREGDCQAGTLALFSPWGNVVMYYAPFSAYSGLYILGEAESGKENIKNLSGTLRVEAVK